MYVIIIISGFNKSIIHNEEIVYFLVGLIITLVVLILLFFFYTKIRTKLNFFILGLDSSFTASDLHLLWKVSQICGLEEPTALFFSLPALTKCMNQITAQAAKDGSDRDPKMQLLITKLFNYRTKIQNKSDEKKGLDTTKSLDVGQKLRIIFPGRGVFVSEVMNNGKDLIISVPRQKDLITFSTGEWIGQVVNVYLWRKGDARYVFDSVVLDQAVYIGKPVLKLKHSANLIRTQKRKSTRAKCQIDGELFIIREKIKDYNAVETQNGYKCRIEDISESGALIRIGGQGVPNIQIKLQYTINNMLIIMFGEVRTVEYNEQLKQSLLHFECTHIEQAMKNEVLKFVFNILPDNEKEILTALTLLNEDEIMEAGRNAPHFEEEKSSAPDVTTTVYAPVSPAPASESMDTVRAQIQSKEKQAADKDNADTFSEEGSKKDTRFDNIDASDLDNKINDMEQINVF